MCVRKCPSNAIKVTRNPKVWSFEKFRCILCGSCVEACPKKCLKLVPRLTEEKSGE
jgi:formate hydrogenlyase subunit 6/NADH:ubiquinone oxidoreductase subunit I